MRFPNSGIRAKVFMRRPPAGATGTCGHGCLQRDARRGGRLQGGALKGLLVGGEVARVVPAHGQAARVDCPRRGHRGSARPRLAHKAVATAA
ncbi:hypothetical protein GW17_00044377 [Ensete ventricosum]|nr:hypothetical protein GW17_00044377 [Ensete ventricosum]RZR92718.1 hypothetical protein BHM03_00021073 [Ensete ventricosum]